LRAHGKYNYRGDKVANGNNGPSRRRLRLVDELAGPSGNMGFGWGKQPNNVTDNMFLQ